MQFLDYFGPERIVSAWIHADKNASIYANPEGARDPAHESGRRTSTRMNPRPTRDSLAEVERRLQESAEGDWHGHVANEADRRAGEQLYGELAERQYQRYPDIDASVSFIQAHLEAELAERREQLGLNRRQISLIFPKDWNGQ